MLTYYLFIKKIKLCGLKVQGSIGCFCPDGSRVTRRALCNVTSILVLTINNLSLTSKNEY